MGTRPARPPWQGWLLPLSGTKLLGDHLPAAADHLFSRRMHRRARQTRQFNSSRPSRQEALGTLGRVESPPEAQLLTEEGSSVSLHWFCPAARHVLFAACSPFLPSAKPLALLEHYPAVPSHLPRVFLLLCAVLSALYLALPKARGRAGGWWSGRKRRKLMLRSRSEKSLPCPDRSGL